MLYRIEVYVRQDLRKSYETDDFQEAARFYHRNNDMDDRWTKLIVDGETGNKAWMDRKMKSGRIPKKFVILD